MSFHVKLERGKFLCKLKRTGGVNVTSPLLIILATIRANPMHAIPARADLRDTSATPQRSFIFIFVFAFPLWRWRGRVGVLFGQGHRLLGLVRGLEGVRFRGHLALDASLARYDRHCLGLAGHNGSLVICTRARERCAASKALHTSDFRCCHRCSRGLAGLRGPPPRSCPGSVGDGCMRARCRALTSCDRDACSSCVCGGRISLSSGGCTTVWRGGHTRHRQARRTTSAVRAFSLADSSVRPRNRANENTAPTPCATAHTQTPLHRTQGHATLPPYRAPMATPHCPPYRAPRATPHCPPYRAGRSKRSARRSDRSSTKPPRPPPPPAPQPTPHGWCGECGVCMVW